MFIYISPPSLLRLFPCSLLVSVSIVFLLIPWGSHAFPPLWFLSDAVFIVFPCPSLIVFSSFSIPLGAACPRFHGFPFVSLTVVACRGAVRYCSPPVPVSSPVSVFDAVGRGGVACSVGWGIVPWRGVEGMAGCLAAFCLAARFLRCAGRGVLVGFFHVEIIGRVVRGARRICCVEW